MSEPRYRQTFPSGLLELRDIPAWIHARLLESSEAEPDQIDAVMPSLELAVQEHCVNVVTHAYGGEPGRSLDLIVTVVRETVRVEVIDNGPEFDPADVAPPEPGELQVHGFGVGIIRALTTEYRVERIDGQNVATMVFAIPSARSEGAR
jgi:anti-sigma regulatory factor (Ser/Thr protein kinase)